MNAMVFGVSPDSAKSHRKFREKYGLPYNLLVDEEHRLADQYGFWKEKTLYGVKYMGIERSTVVIDAGGRVARIFRKVKVDGHVDDVREAVGKLG
jgi:thioredoxin-dependent peroxiredoxin